MKNAQKGVIKGDSSTRHARRVFSEIITTADP